MEKETLEEAAEKHYPIFQRSTAFGSKFPWTPHKERESFKKGAKWQAERMYSEEEVLNLLEFVNDRLPDLYSRFNPKAELDECFEQFKK